MEIRWLNFIGWRRPLRKLPEYTVRTVSITVNVQQCTDKDTRLYHWTGGFDYCISLLILWSFSLYSFWVSVILQLVCSSFQLIIIFALSDVFVTSLLNLPESYKIYNSFSIKTIQVIFLIISIIDITTTTLMATEISLTNHTTIIIMVHHLIICIIIIYQDVSSSGVIFIIISWLLLPTLIMHQSKIITQSSSCHY